MKLSTLLCASILAFGAVALMADGALAATTVKSSKSNSSFKLDASADAAKKCTDAGGTVYTAANGDKMCVMPGAAVTNVSSSKSNGDARTASITEKACTDKGGSVLTDSAGNKICLMPDTAPAPAH